MNKYQELSDGTTLRDVMESDHEADCICDECTKELSDESGDDYIYWVRYDGINKFLFRIDPFVRELECCGYRRHRSDVSAIALVNWSNGKEVTIMREVMSDNYNL